MLSHKNKNDDIQQNYKRQKVLKKEKHNNYDNSTYTLKTMELLGVPKVTELSKQIFHNGHYIQKSDISSKSTPKGQGFAVVAWKGKEGILFIDLVPAFNLNDGKPRTNKMGKPYFIFTQEYYDHPERLPKDIDWSNVAVESPEALGNNSGAIHAFAVCVLQLSGRIPKELTKENMFGLGIFKGGSVSAISCIPLFAQFRNHSANLNSESLKYNRELLLANFYSPPSDPFKIIDDAHTYYIQRVLANDITQIIFNCLLKDLYFYHSVIVLEEKDKNIFQPDVITLQWKNDLLIVNYIDENGVRTSSMGFMDELNNEPQLEVLKKPGFISKEIDLINLIAEIFNFKYLPKCLNNAAKKLEEETWWELFHDNPSEKNLKLLRTLLRAIAIKDKNINKIFSDIIPLMKRNHELMISKDKSTPSLFTIPSSLAKDIESYNILSYAIRNNINISVINQLIEASPDLITENNPLNLAIKNGSLPIVKSLLDAKADLGTSEDCGTPLLSAVSWGNKAIVETLLIAKANINQPDCDGTTPLIIATLYSSEIVKTLVDNKANVNCVWTDNQTPLSLAIGKGNILLVDTLLNNRADPNFAMKNGQTPLIFAIIKNNPVKVGLIINKLLAENADINKAANDGTTALFWAIKNNNYDVMMTLLNAKAHVETTRKVDGTTPLFQAIQNGNIPMVQALIKAKADVNKVDYNGLRPIDHTQDENILKMLNDAILSAKSWVKLKDSLETTLISVQSIISNIMFFPKYNTSNLTSLYKRKELSINIIKAQFKCDYGKCWEDESSATISNNELIIKIFSNLPSLYFDDINKTINTLKEKGVIERDFSARVCSIEEAQSDYAMLKIPFSAISSSDKMENRVKPFSLRP